MATLILNSQIRHEEAPVLRWTDPAIQYSWAGFFETMRADDTQIKRLNRHLERLNRSLRHWNLAPPCDEPTLRRALEVELARHADSAKLRIKLMVGPDPDSPQNPNPDYAPTRAWIQAFPLDAEYSKSIGERSAYRVGLFRDFAISTTHPLAGFKSTQYALYSEARRRIRAVGLDEGILLNERGEIAEACYFNVFWISANCLFTPDSRAGCLPGVMAAEITEVARSIGIEVQECLARPNELLNADAAFLTNSVAEIIEIGEVEGKRLSPARAHPIVKKILSTLS